MHERHIVEGLVKQILQKAQIARAKKVLEIRLVLGSLSGLDEGSVRLYFDDLAAGTILEGAKLTVKPVVVKLRCKRCGIDFERRGEDINCPQCCSIGFLNQTGTECYIESIEVETED